MDVRQHQRQAVGREPDPTVDHVVAGRDQAVEVAVGEGRMILGRHQLDELPACIGHNIGSQAPIRSQ